MDSPEFVDPYLDPDTGLLRNLVGAKTSAELDLAEGDLVFARMMELITRPLVEATSDLDELRSIHGWLFQDVYDGAGQIRTVDLTKNVEGSEFFLPVSMIERSSGFAVAELRADHALKQMSREQLIDRLAYHYDQFNYIHPFREGNGRTQRMFWSRIARDAGWQLDWRSIHGVTNDQASRAAAEDRDIEPLKVMFAQIVSKATPKPGRGQSWRQMEHGRLSFPQQLDD